MYYPTSLLAYGKVDSPITCGEKSPPQKQKSDKKAIDPLKSH